MKSGQVLTKPVHIMVAVDHGSFDFEVVCKERIASPLAGKSRLVAMFFQYGDGQVVAFSLRVGKIAARLF